MYSNFSKSTGPSADRPLKRARKVQSCARCRRRKIKCDLDGQGGPCSKCRQARVDCTMWDDDYEDPKKPAPSRQQRLSLASTQSTATSSPSSPDSFAQGREPVSRESPSSDTPTYTPPFVARCEGLDLLSQASFTAIALDREEVKARTPETPAFADPADESKWPRLHATPKSPRQAAAQSKPVLCIPANGPLAALISANTQTRILASIPSCADLVLNPRSPCTPWRSRPQQPLSTLDWFGAYRAAGHDASAVRCLEELGCFDLPCDDVIESIVATYWEHVHPAFPLLDATEFEEELWGGERHNLPSLALIWAVLLAGARHSHNTFIADHVQGVRGACSQFHSRASALLDLDRSVSVMSKIQTGLLLGLYGEGDKTGDHIATAIRLAQRDLLGECDSIPVNRAMRRRVWWSAVAADRLVAAIEGMTPIIPDGDLDLELCPTLADFVDEDDVNVFSVSSDLLRLCLLLGRALVSRNVDTDLAIKADAQSFTHSLGPDARAWHQTIAFYHLAITAYISNLDSANKEATSDICRQIVALVSPIPFGLLDCMYGPFAIWAMESALVAIVKESAVAVMHGYTTCEAEEGRERCHALVEALRALSTVWWGAEAKFRLAEVLQTGFPKTSCYGQITTASTSTSSVCSEDSIDTRFDQKAYLKFGPHIHSIPSSFADNCRVVSVHSGVGSLGLTGMTCIV